jgi:peptide/nickel transport system permease protein
VFFTAQLLPGDVGRHRLGNLAPQSAVDALNHRLGVDRPLLTQYWDWITGFVRGDWGNSLDFDTPARPIVWDALVHSLKLAVVAFVIVVPLSILGGVIAALRYQKFTDRAITITGLSLTVVPEFVSAIALITVIAIGLGWLPVSAQAPPGAGPLLQVKHLLLPAFALSAVLFGYIARMARAGTIEALDSDYTRTAYLKGLPRGTVLRRHVLRNALLPTITVVAAQTGYLIGGLVVIETLFNYQGIGLLTYNSAVNKDMPVLEASVLLLGLVYLVTTLLADLAYSLLNPRIRYASAE